MSVRSNVLRTTNGAIGMASDVGPQFSGPVALVVGCAQGIGKATAVDGLACV